MKQGRVPDVQMSPADKVVYGKKSLVPGCNTLAYRKDNYIDECFLLCDFIKLFSDLCLS